MPGIAENLMKQTEKALQHQEGLGAPPVLLVNPALRLMLSRYLRRIFPQLAVLSSREINTQRNVRMTYLIGERMMRAVLALLLVSPLAVAADGSRAERALAAR